MENSENIKHKTRYLHFNNYGQDIFNSAKPQIVTGLFKDSARKHKNLYKS